MEQSQISRRQFVNGTARAGLGALAAPLVSNRVLGANDRLVMAIIGAGGMGRGHMRYFMNQGVKWAAVCDIYAPHRNLGLQIAGPQAKGYNDYREVLDQKEIDAVLIATPEHWHHDQLIDAVRAGKDAYCEKPMSWSIEEGASMIREVRKTDRVVQIGMQRRSAPAIIETKRLIDDGVLGEIDLVRAEWWWNLPPVDRTPELQADKLDWNRFLGRRKKQPFDPVKYRYWRYFWDFSGGNMTDQGTHLIDVIQWFMNADRPVSAVTHGAVYKLQPAETPDTFSAVFEYPKFMATWTLCYTNSFQKGWAIVFQGQKATLELSEQGYKIYPEPWNTQKLYCRWEIPAGVKEVMPGNVTSKDPHVRNFLDCVKSRRQPNATVEIGHSAVRTLHLANIAHRNRTRATLSADGTSAKT